MIETVLRVYTVYEALSVESCVIAGWRQVGRIYDQQLPSVQSTGQCAGSRRGIYKVRAVLYRILRFDSSRTAT
jgi:hypothetical protein